MSSYDKYYSNHESKSFIKVCNLCKTEIKYENSTKHTSNLRNHLHYTVPSKSFRPLIYFSFFNVLLNFLIDFSFL